MVPADWWIQWRDREPVQSALARAHCAYWAEVVEEVLLANERAERHPKSWEEVALGLYRHFKNVERWREGRQRNYAPAAYLALSAIVGVEASELVPGNVRWLATAVRLLTESRFTTEECRPLAACMLTLSGDQPVRLSRNLIASALDQVGANQELDRAETLANEILQDLSRRLQSLD